MVEHVPPSVESALSKLSMLKWRICGSEPNPLELHVRYNLIPAYNRT